MGDAHEHRGTVRLVPLVVGLKNSFLVSASARASPVPSVVRESGLGKFFFGDDFVRCLLH